MKKRTAIRIISYCLAAVLALSGFWISERYRSRKFKLRLQNGYSEALSELDSRLNNIKGILFKVEFVSSPKLVSSYAAELYSDAELAKSALSRMSGGSMQSETLYKFLSQVGNFALSVSNSVIEGSEISEEQHKMLNSLSKTAEAVAETVGNLRINGDNAQSWAKEIKNLENSGAFDGSLANSLTEMEEDLSDYPTLIYDGPYSDHILNKEPAMLKNADEIDKKSALEKAVSILGEGVGSLDFEDSDNGKLSSYRFSNDNVSISISRHGGYTVFMRKSRAVGDTRLSYDTALSKAKDFMSLHGLKNMVDTYYYSDEGVCVINFACLDGQTVCYTDLIKVGVAMDNGEIMLYEASGYLSNHTERSLEQPQHTCEEAMASLSHELSVESSTLALIPTDSGKEVMCYEFLCRTENDQAILIYINTSTLETEQVLILLETDGGTLVK